MSDENRRANERALAMTPEQAVQQRVLAQQARAGVLRRCGDCGAYVPPLAWSWHRYEHEYEQAVKAKQGEIASFFAGRPSKALPSHPDAPIGSRARRYPLWHRIVLQPNDQVVRFFGSSSVPDPGDTNLPGQGGSMPAATAFLLFGISLVPDRSARPGDVGRVRDHGRVRFLVGAQSASPPNRPTTIGAEFPDRTLIPPSREWAAGDQILAHPDAEFDFVPMAPLMVNGEPVCLPPLLCFHFDLWLEPGLGQVGRPTGLMLVCHGIWAHGAIA